MINTRSDDESRKHRLCSYTLPPNLSIITLLVSHELLLFLRLIYVILLQSIFSSENLRRFLRIGRHGLRDDV